MSRIAIIHFVNYKRGTQSRAAMRGVMLYVMQEKKTAWDGVPLVSGVNCQPQSVYDDFLNTKLLYHKDGGTMFYHTYCHPQQAQKEQAADSMLTMLRPDGEQIFNLAAVCPPKRHSA